MILIFCNMSSADYFDYSMSCLLEEMKESSEARSMNIKDTGQAYSGDTMDSQVVRRKILWSGMNA